MRIPHLALPTATPVPKLAFTVLPFNVNTPFVNANSLILDGIGPVSEVDPYLTDGCSERAVPRHTTYAVVLLLLSEQTAKPLLTLEPMHGA